MRKVTFTLPLALLLSLTAYAQIGVKAGVTFGGTYGSAEEFNGDKIESIDPAVGYQFGITTTLVDLPAFDLRAELLYENRRGVKNIDVEILRNPGNTYRAETELRNSFQYLSLPLLASFGGDGVNVYLGPSVSYLLSARAKSTFESTGTARTESEIDFINDKPYEDSYINRFNVAANVGVLLPIGPRASVDIRLYHTVTDVTNDSEDRSIIDQILLDPQNVSLRDDNDSTVGLQANLAFRF